MTILITILILLLTWLSGRHRAIQDTLRTKTTYLNSIFSDTKKYDINKYHPEHSWKSMYKVDKNGDVIRPLKPRFFLSTSLLVSFTDQWHKSATIERLTSIASIVLAMMLDYPLLIRIAIVIAAYLLSLLIFTIYYKKYKIKK